MLQESAGFRAAVCGSDGKLTRDGMVNAALVVGLGAAAPHTMYRARAKINDTTSQVCDEMFEAMGQYLFDVCTSNPGSFYEITTSTGNVFRAAFLTLGPVQALLRVCAKPVTRLDAGHSKALVFKGVYMLGMFQTGSGRCIVGWAACCGGDCPTDDA